MHRALNSLASLAVLLHLFLGCGCHEAHSAEPAGELGAATPSVGVLLEPSGVGEVHRHPADHDHSGDHRPTPTDHAPGCSCGACDFVVPQRTVVSVSHEPGDMPLALSPVDTALAPLVGNRVCRAFVTDSLRPSAALYLLNRALLL